MKNYIIPILSAVLLSSCSLAENYENNEDFTRFPENHSAEKVDVQFNFAGLSPVTKITGNHNDSTLNNIQVLVFDASGKINAYTSVDNSSSANLKVSMGTLDCYAIANVTDDLSGVVTKTELLAKKSNLKSNFAQSLQMIGHTSKEVSKTDHVVNITLTRFAAMVELDRIEVAKTAQVIGKTGCKLDAIYLINVPGEIKYDFSQVDDMIWYNKCASDEDSDAYMLLFDAGMSKTLSPTSPMTDKHIFYTYPNVTTGDSFGQTWSPRLTRLVVEVTINGRKYYYPVNIAGADGKINPNHKYVITKMTLTGPGADSPDEILTRDSIDIEVKVEKWTESMNTDVTY